MVQKQPQFFDTKPAVEEEYPTRATLETAVSSALATAGGIDATEVAVVADGSVISLTGSVHQAEEIGRAEDVARAVPGVTQVRNGLHAATNSSDARGL